MGSGGAWEPESCGEPGPHQSQARTPLVLQRAVLLLPSRPQAPASTQRANRCVDKVMVPSASEELTSPLRLVPEVARLRRP